MFSSRLITAKSSWPVSAPAVGDETPKPLSGTEAENLLQKNLRVHQGSFEFDPETMVEVESCVQLNCPFMESDMPSEKSRSQCELAFECSSRNVSMSRLVLASQCKRAEVYGPTGEYKLTKEGVLLDDSDPDMILFLIDANLEKLDLASFSIKLTGLNSQCWILALHLGLNEHVPPHQFPSRFNLQNMNQILETSGAVGDLKLSDKAKEFKQLFETFQKSQSGSVLTGQGSFSPSMLMSSPHISSLLTSQNQLEAPTLIDTIRSSEASEVQDSCCKFCAGELKKIEDRLTKKLEDIQRTQSEKLDKILALLEKPDSNNS